MIVLLGLAAGACTTPRAADEPRAIDRAVVGLVLLEQLLRNTPSDLLRAIKYLCFRIGGMFVYEFYLYSDALLFQRIDPALWEARGFINATVVPVIGIALA